MSSKEVHTSLWRTLRPKEQDLLESVLPAERPGYKQYRDLIRSMVVIGDGRRGRGNFVLGYEGDTPDLTSPLSPVVAYGVVETTRDTFTVTVREKVANQIDVEIVSSRGDEIPDHFEEKRRWTYSTWSPGSRSPATYFPVREIPIEKNVVLAISKEEKRLWVYHGDSGMNLLIPITNFYNELMLLRKTRDPKIALSSNLLFGGLHTYSDHELRKAFIAYNKLKRKVETTDEEYRAAEERFRKFLPQWFHKKG